MSMLRIIIISVAIAAKWKLNVGFDFIQKQRLEVSLDKAFEYNDMKEITNEVFENKKVKIKSIEVFKTAVEIDVEDVTDEEITKLKEKLNEKYNLVDTENSESWEVNLDQINVIQTTIPAIRLRQIVKLYIWPVIIETVLTIIYVAVAYRKLGVGKVIANLLANIVSAEIVYFGIITVFRIEINKLTMPIAMVIYILATIYTMINNNKEMEMLENEK